MIGIPLPSITWLRNGTDLFYSPDSRYIYNNTVFISPIEINGTEYCEATYTFTLNMSTYEDSGTYECMVSNGVLPGDSAEFELAFHSKF